MAADNRNFADVLDIQGTEVCLADKKLAETSSETGVQTTDYVLLQDTDGAYHKILKRNFTEAIRNTLAGLLVNNDKGTSVNQIPAIASGDLGSVTPANLASVLGAGFFKQRLYSGGDFNNIKTNAIVSVENCSTNNPASMKYGVLFCSFNGNIGYQLYIPNSSDNYIYIRPYYNDSFRDWQRITIGALGYLSSYTSLADLASALGGVSTSVAKNGGTTTVSTGVYAIGHPNYGYCLVSISESNNAGVFVEIGGVTLATLDVSIARTGTRTFTITNNNTDGTRLVKPILIMG